MNKRTGMYVMRKDVPWAVKRWFSRGGKILFATALAECISFLEKLPKDIGLRPIANRDIGVP